MEKGELIPDDMVMEMVGGRLSERDTSGRGFVLDGCPRTTRQAESLEKIVQPFGLDLVIDLQVPTNLVMKRLASRRVCVDCGANYSTAAPPLVELDLRRVRRRGRPARGRHRGGHRAPAQPLRGGDGPAARLVQGAQPPGRDQRHRLTRRGDAAGGRRHRHPAPAAEGAQRPREAQRGRAGQDAPRRQGRGRDARGDPCRRQARRHDRWSWTRSPATSSSAGAPPRTSSATTGSPPSSARRPTP